MCGRFELAITEKELIQVFDIDQSQLNIKLPRYNIPPGTPVPIVRQLGEQRILDEAYWGLIPSWSKDKKIAQHTINARSETVAEKPSFRAAYKRRRCLLPATGYYEWRRLADNKKQPYWIGLKDKSVFAMAGLYENWVDPQTGESIESCTIVTREALSNIKHIHPRMPVILPRHYYQLWLHNALQDFPLIDADELDSYPISPAVNSPHNNYPFPPLDIKNDEENEIT